MNKFIGIEPSTEDYWRSLILFGKNVASYKFALGKALLELGKEGKSFISLEELAVPFSRHLTEHLKIEDKQTTSNSSRFLDSCRGFNQGTITEDELIATTVRLGFENVIDAFHNLSSGEIPQRFFTYERKGQNKGIILTDELFTLIENEQSQNLAQEVEARWRLVETAWNLNISRNLITIGYDPQQRILFTNNYRRIDITSCRDALNGYQKGKCFYCFTQISIESDAEDLADVDHFFPHVLAQWIQPIDGVWNLVLACQSCNRGEGGKFDRLSHLRYLERLHTRNEFLINSHHPLRETLIQQTGISERQRIHFLETQYHSAQKLLGTPDFLTWQTIEEPPCF